MGGTRAGTLPVAAEQATARGKRGIVLAAAPLAAAHGAETMRQGGNAFDGAVTAALVEAVMLPSKCGLAGDIVAIAVRAGEPEPTVLLAIGEAPAGLAASALQHGLQATGPLSVGVPGAPAGYAALAAEGRLPLTRLAGPAIAAARDGFVWPEINHALSRESRSLVLAQNSRPNRYFPDREPLPPHAVVSLPGLAGVLEEFVTRGASLFVSPLGEVVAGYVAGRGGVLTLDDFEKAKAEWVAPERLDLGDRLLWATPAPTHGSSLLAAVGASATGVWDAVTAASLRRIHDPSGTSIVSAADDDGNVVVVIHSNSFPRFGSGLVVPDLDLILSNRPGRGFSPDPNHPNFPALGRRPATTLHAWALSDTDRRPVMVGGTPGGENQMPWNTQLVLQVLGGETDPGMLVVSPRWELGPDGAIVVEEGVDDATVRELSGRTTQLERVPRWGLRSAYQVVSVPRPGAAIVGAVDPRTGGAGVPV